MWFKIGFTQRPVADRAEDIQQQIPFGEIIICGAIAAPQCLETRLVYMFSCFRSKYSREWFRLPARHALVLQQFFGEELDAEEQAIVDLRACAWSPGARS